MLPIFFLELTNDCNFSCSYCPIREMSRSTGYMSARNAFQQLNAAKKEGYRVVTFHVLGEPLLHPQATRIISYASNLGFSTILTTNGSLFNPDNRKLLGGKVDIL